MWYTLEKLKEFFIDLKNVFLQLVRIYLTTLSWIQPLPVNLMFSSSTSLSMVYYRIDFFVAGVGTGGTITGVGRVLKEILNDVKVVAVEPANSPVLSGGEPGKHGIQGIGPGFIPKILDLSIIDEIVTVTEEEALEGMKLLARKEELFVGISSGANLWAALRIAEKIGRKDVRIVTIAPDHGERYISAL